MPDKEATARIKVNKLLEAAGWRFFADGSAPANIRLEPSVTIKSTDLDAFGANNSPRLPFTHEQLAVPHCKAQLERCGAHCTFYGFHYKPDRCVRCSPRIVT